MIAGMDYRRAASSPVFAMLLLLAALLLAGCGSSDDDGGSDAGSKSDAKVDAAEVADRADSYEAPPTTKLDPDLEHVVRMETDKGTFDIDLDPKAAPIAAANFAFLVGEGYYDGITFHRVIKDFMVQAGDPLGTGTGGPGYTLKDDPVRGDYVRGTVAMANAGPDTGGSQFFIVHGTNVDLPKAYVIFGSVDEEGMEVVDEIAAVEVEPGPTGEPSSPVEPVRITRATVVSPK
jgi:cyclophilin family peptidyl-prolyl cis-trans isomerase